MSPVQFRHYAMFSAHVFEHLVLGREFISRLLETRHEKTCLMPYVNNKGADQPAHPRGLNGAFVIRCLDNIKPTFAKAKISRL